MELDPADVPASRRERRLLRELLLATTRRAGREARTGDEATTRLAELVRAAPIEKLPAAAMLHRLPGTVRRGLVGIGGVPESVRTELDSATEMCAMQHLLMTATLGTIGSAFDREGLAWLTMKGPAVATLLYPSPDERLCGDLDLLIARNDFPRAVEMLEDLGYVHLTRNWSHTEEILAGELAMTGSHVHLDVHWHLHYKASDRRPFSLDPETMIRRSRRVDLANATTPTFDRVDTLMNLAFHAARSDGHRLFWIKDIERSLAVEVTSDDHDELIRRCHRARCGAAVGVMLARAKRLLDADVPDDVIGQLVGPSYLAIERATTAVVDPIQFHERDTLTRAVTRSARSNTVATVTAIPRRAVGWYSRRFHPPPESNTDDPDEKAAYFAAVVGSPRP